MVAAARQGKTKKLQGLTRRKMNEEEKNKRKDEKDEKAEKKEEKKEEKRNLRQSTLDKTIERKENKRKVNFEMDKRTEIEQLKKVLSEEIKSLKNERLELEKLKITFQQKEMVLEERLEKIESRLSAIEISERERRELLPAERGDNSSYWERRSGGATSTGGESWSEAEDGRSTGGAVSSRSGRSVYSAWSLEDEEVGRIRKMIREKDRKDREKNIVIKGVRIENDNLKEGVKELLADRLGLQVRIDAAWKGGKVVIAMLESVDEKRKVMACKNKLAGSKVFIENDLGFEDRKRQEIIAKWVKLRREEGWVMKIGIGRVYVEGRWIRWEDKGALREIEEKRKKEKERVEENNNTESVGKGEENEQEYSEEQIKEYFG